MKIANLFLLITLTLTASLNAEMGATINSGQTSQNIERDVQQYEEAAFNILNTQPTTMLGDFAREDVAIVGSIIVGCIAGSIQPSEKSRLTVAMITAAIIYPLFRVGFDKTIRNSGIVDKYLDTLISEKNLNLEALSMANIDTRELETKIKELGNKWGLIRFPARCASILIPTIIAFIASYHLPHLATNSPNTDLIADAVAAIITFALCWYAVVIQSSGNKQSSRLEKLGKLRLLIAQAKRMANKTSMQTNKKEAILPVETVEI